MSNEQEVTLYKTKLAAMSKLSNEQWMGLKFVTGEEPDDFVHNMLTAKLTAYLYGEPGESQTISYPSDWWSAFKHRWFPAWLLKRYPARITTHEINLLTLYPRFKVSLPDQYHVLKYKASKDERHEPLTDEDVDL